MQPSTDRGPVPVSGPAPLEWVRPPQQQRSQQTLERLLDAAEALLVESGSSGLTVAAVARRASSSVGAFYARFSDKEALLGTLHVRACEQSVATAAAALDPERWHGTPLAACLEELVAFILTITQQRQGLWHAFLEAAMRDAVFAERRGQTADAIAAHLHTFLQTRSAEATHGDLSLAASIIVRMLLATAEMETLRGADYRLDLGPAPELTTELTCAALAYLGVRDDRS